MDFVYICRAGDNEELRYSIRSVIHSFPEARIWVVGGKPDWYLGQYIEVDQANNKYLNTINNLKVVCKSIEISNNFVLMNDDFFILSKNNEYRYYDGLLKDKIINHSNIYGNSSYARALRGSIKALKKKGIEEPLNYEVHMPMKLNKTNLESILDLSLAPRSMYGNIFINNGIEMKDVKIYKHTKEFDFNKDFISTEDTSFNLIKNKLDLLFSEKTIYEL